jgi:hypothetical protein
LLYGLPLFPAGDRRRLSLSSEIALKDKEPLFKCWDAENPGVQSSLLTQEGVDSAAIERLFDMGQNPQEQMRREFSRAFLILLIGQISFGLPSAKAGPLDFFRRVRESIAHPRHHQRMARPTQPKDDNSQSNNGSTVQRNDVRPPEPKEPQATESSGPVTIRATSSVAPGQRSRADVPYGVPVPNKPGFVVSPYSPNAGYVDVRGFPSGTEVKDPYTGKVFITP